MKESVAKARRACRIAWSLRSVQPHRPQRCWSNKQPRAPKERVISLKSRLSNVSFSYKKRHAAAIPKLYLAGLRSQLLLYWGYLIFFFFRTGCIIASFTFPSMRGGRVRCVSSRISRLSLLVGLTFIAPFFTSTFSEYSLAPPADASHVLMRDACSPQTECCNEETRENECPCERAVRKIKERNYNDRKTQNDIRPI